MGSERGLFVARAVVTEEMQAETIFAPFHWGDLWTEGGSVNDATHDERDPISQQPELKGAAVRVERVEPERATEEERATVEALSAWDGS